MPRHQSFVWNYVYGKDKTSCTYVRNLVLINLFVWNIHSVTIYKHDFYNIIFHEVYYDEHTVVYVGKTVIILCIRPANKNDVTL